MLIGDSDGSPVDAGQIILTAFLVLIGRAPRTFRYFRHLWAEVVPL